MRVPKSLLALALLLTAAGAYAAPAKSRACIDWPRTLSQYEIDHLPAGAAIQVQSIVDYTKQSGDEWLSQGIRDLVADLLRAGEKVRILAGPTAGATISGPSEFAVGGSFQHIGGKLRIFLAVSDGRTGQLLKQLEMSVPYPDNKDFFVKLADLAQQILSVAKAKVDGEALAAVRDVTPSTRAYESYSRGRQVLWQFSPSKAEIAQAYFNDAKRIDYRSPLGYMGSIDLNSFLGLFHKEQGEPSAPFFQRAEEEMSQMKRLAKTAPPSSMLSLALKGVRRGGMENRFLAGSAAFTEGQQLAQAGKLPEAQAAFTRAVESVPEDALSWYHLSRTEAKRGDTAAATAALQRAYAINSCIEQ